MQIVCNRLMLTPWLRPQSSWTQLQEIWYQNCPLIFGLRLNIQPFQSFQFSAISLQLARFERTKNYWTKMLLVHLLHSTSLSIWPWYDFLEIELFQACIANRFWVKGDHLDHDTWVMDPESLKLPCSGWQGCYCHHLLAMDSNRHFYQHLLVANCIHLCLVWKSERVHHGFARRYLPVK